MGTFDFFTEKINGNEKASRSTTRPSEDDNVLVQGVAGEKGSIGYFGHSYYEENQDKLLAVNSGGGCVKPSVATVQNRHPQAARPAASSTCSCPTSSGPRCRPSSST